MRQQVEQRLNELARRAGLKDVSVTVVRGAVAVAVLIVVWAGWRWWPRDAAETNLGSVETVEARSSPGVSTSAVPAEQGAPASAEVGSTATTNADVFIHVAGSVRHPGVYELPAGSRVVDAIEAAGGAVGDAVPDGLNLARIVVDGEQVFMPSEKDVSKPPLQSGVGNAGAESAAKETAQIDINTAEPGLLDTLPGVGPSTAAKIVAERETNGPFTSIDDLSRVSGIGPKRIEQLRDLVYVR